MRIAISGATGLVGNAVRQHFLSRGDEVVPLVRGTWPARADANWDPTTGALATGPLDAVVHLAGANVAAGRWNAARKRAIADSRIGPTQLLCATLAAATPRPRVLVSASAIGFYGDRGDEELDEHSAGGAGFLADTSRRWEAATHPARDAGIRVVNLRIGMVLAREGGALPRMLRPFRLGLGGRLGSGRQWMSWIALDDLVAAISFALEAPGLAGPVNAVAPQAVTNLDFTRALGRAVRRPALLPAPAFGLRLLLGEMADELLLASQRVRPQALLDAGFTFAHAELDATLAALCG